MNYTALGATVNLASRLETLNKDYGTSVLVSEAVKEQVDSLFLFRSVARIKPKALPRKCRSMSCSARETNIPSPRLIATPISLFDLWGPRYSERMAADREILRR